MCGGRIRYAVLDESGAVLHAAPGEAEFVPYSEIPQASAVAVGGTTTEMPQLLHPLSDPPLTLIRQAAGRGWRIDVHPGWYCARHGSVAP